MTKLTTNTSKTNVESLQTSLRKLKQGFEEISYTEAKAMIEGSRVHVLAGQLSVGDEVYFASRIWEVTGKAGGKVQITKDYEGPKEVKSLLRNQMVEKRVGL